MSTKRQYPTPVSQKVARFYQDVVEHVLEMVDPTTGEMLSGPFVKLPPRKLYPDYYEVVKSPISIAEIKSRSINTKRKPRTEICSVPRFAKMWDLMVANSKVYNASESLIVQFAESINEYVQSEVKTFQAANVTDLAIAGVDGEGDVLESNELALKKQRVDSTTTTGTGIAATGGNESEKEYISNFKYPFSEEDYVNLKKKGNEELPRILKHLLSFKMSHHKNSQPLSKPFVHLPSPNNVNPDLNASIDAVTVDPKMYFDTVDSPMSFNIIQGRLNSNVYANGQLGLDRFHYDVDLLISNILAIYSEGSTIWKCANGLQRAFAKRWDRFLGKKEEPVKAEAAADYEDDEEEEEEDYEGPDDDDEEEELDQGKHGAELGITSNGDNANVSLVQTPKEERKVPVLAEEEEEEEEIYNEESVPQFIRKHEEPIQFSLTSITLKSIELNTNTLTSTGNDPPVTFFSTTVLEPNEKEFSIQLPSEAVVNREVVIELRLMGSIAGEKFQLECNVNGEKVPGRIPNEYQIEDSGSFIARTMLMRIGYGLNLLQWDLQVANGVTESSKVWINVTN